MRYPLKGTDIRSMLPLSYGRFHSDDRALTTFHQIDVSVEMASASAYFFEADRIDTRFMGRTISAYKQDGTTCILHNQVWLSKHVEMRHWSVVALTTRRQSYQGPGEQN